MAYTCRSCFIKVDGKKVLNGMCKHCSKARNEKKVLIGYCGVDSGQLLIVDPCYAFKKMSEKEAEDMYASCGDVTLKRELGAGEIIVSPPGGNGTVFQTGWGDGNYPVYADYVGGRIVKVVIDMK